LIRWWRCGTNDVPQQHAKVGTLGITRHKINCAVAVKISRGYSPCAWSNRYRRRLPESTASIAEEYAYAVATNGNDVHGRIAINIGDN
jgi:hypothetical protein